MLGPESNHGINVVSKGEKLDPKQRRRYRNNNSEVVRYNARREKELIEKQKRIQLVKMEQKRKRELRNKSVNPQKKDQQANENYSMVKMNSLLTLEQLLDIHTQQVNDIMPSFVIGGPQTMKNGDLSVSQPTGLGMQTLKDKSQSGHPREYATTESQSFKIQDDQRFSSIKAKTIALKKEASGKIYKFDNNQDQKVFNHHQTSVSRALQNHPNNDLPLSSARRFKSSHMSNYMESKKVSTQEELISKGESSQMQHETLMGGRSLMGIDSNTKDN